MCCSRLSITDNRYRASSCLGRCGSGTQPADKAVRMKSIATDFSFIPSFQEESHLFSAFMSPVNVKIRRRTLSKVWNAFMQRSRPFLFFHLNAQVHIIKRSCLWNPRTKASWSVSLASLPFFSPVPALWWLWLKTLWVRLYTFVRARVHLTSTSSISAAPASLLPHRTQRKLKALCRYVFNGPCFFSFSLTLFFFFPSPSLRLDAPSLPPSLPLVNLIQGPGWQKRGE